MDLQRRFIVVLWLAAFFSCSAVVVGQSSRSCSDGDKAHQFDFWIGEWKVTAGGKPAGNNSIQPILDGCVLQENWVGVPRMSHSPSEK